MRPLLLVVALIVTTLFFEAPVAAQDRTANKQIGGWTVYCRADGMTDRLTCEMISVSRRAGSESGATGPILLWRDATEAPGVRLLKNGHVSVEGAFLRVGRGAPASLPNCRGRGGACMASIADDRRVGAEIASGAASALLRIGSLSSGEDWVFDLSEFAAAREELRRLRAAASLPMPARPFDELERETAADERARAAFERQSGAVCGRESARDREYCIATAHICAARGEDVATCVAPFMNRRRYDAHLDRTRVACRAKPPGEDARCLQLVHLCFGAEKTIRAFDACFQDPPTR